MGRTRFTRIHAFAQSMGYGFIFIMTITAVAVAQQPAYPPNAEVAPLPPVLPADPNPMAQQPVPVGPTETLEAAWAVALRSDEQIAASRWNVEAAQSGWNAARAERMPSLTMGAEY